MTSYVLKLEERQIAVGANNPFLVGLQLGKCAFRLIVDVEAPHRDEEDKMYT